MVREMSDELTLKSYSSLFQKRLEQWRNVEKCPRCGMPMSFREARLIPETGGCLHCSLYLEHTERVADFRLEQEMLDLVERFRARGDSDYDAIVCYSGGKDSTYLLDRFKNEYGLRVLAVTMCTGVNSPTAKENIAVGTRNMGVDHHWLDCDPWLMDVYRFGFMAHSDKGLECDVCDLCDGHTRRRILELAIQKNIPIVVHGADHFQLIDSGLSRGCELLFDQDACWPAVARTYDRFRDRYRLPQLESLTRPPLELYPFLYLPYNEVEICETVEAKGLVMEADPDATNCDFVFLINILEFLRHGFPAYVHNTAAAVLQGELDVEQARIELEEWLVEYAEGVYDEQVFIGLPKLGLTMDQLLDPGPVKKVSDNIVRGAPLGLS